jgi:hypothetical protein
MPDRFSALLWHTCIVGCLLGVVATGYFLAGLAGLVRHPVAIFGVAGSLALGGFFFLYAWTAAFRDTNLLGRFFWVLALFVLAGEIILSLLPPTARDELTHHLAIPRLYAQAGRVVEVPIAPYSYFPMLVDMLYTPWVYWGYDWVPKLVHNLFGLLTGLILYAYLARRMNGIYGLIGFFFFLSVPVILRLSHWAYVDLGLTFYTTASLLCLLRWREEKNLRSWLLLAALSAGFAVTVKPNGLLALLLLTFLFLLALANQRSRGVLTISSDILTFALFALLPVLPWAIKNFVQTGNPFFPHFSGFFAGRVTESVASAASHAGLGIFAIRELLYGESRWQIALLPLRIFFSGRDDSPQYFDGVLGPALILLLPWAFSGKWVEEKRFLIVFALLFFAFAVFLVDLRIRYILPIVPPLVILSIYGGFNVYLRIKKPAILFAGALLLAGFNVSYLWSYIRDTRAVGYVTGHEDRETYLTRVLTEYPVFQYANQKTPSSAKIYLLFVGRRAYYCERDYFHDGGELPGLLLNAIRSAHDPAQIAKTLMSKNITHLMIREALLERFLGDNLSAQQRDIWNAFVTRRLQMRFRARGYALYQIYG